MARSCQNHKLPRRYNEATSSLVVRGIVFHDDVASQWQPNHDICASIDDESERMMQEKFVESCINTKHRSRNRALELLVL